MACPDKSPAPVKMADVMDLVHTGRSWSSCWYHSNRPAPQRAAGDRRDDCRGREVLLLLLLLPLLLVLWLGSSSLRSVSLKRLDVLVSKSRVLSVPMEK